MLRQMLEKNASSWSQNMNISLFLYLHLNQAWFLLLFSFSGEKKSQQNDSVAHETRVFFHIMFKLALGYLDNSFEKNTHTPNRH